MTAERWTFEPCVPDKYKESTTRVLLLGAEPNGRRDKRTNKPIEEERPDRADMGVWMMQAPSPPEGKKPFFGNKRFYLHMLLHAELAVRGKAEVFKRAEDGCTKWQADAEKFLAHVRVADLKATEGGATAKTEDVRDHVLTSPDHIRDLFDPLPHRIVVQGGHARTIFLEILLPRMLAGDKSDGWFDPNFDPSMIEWTALPHPAARLSYRKNEDGDIHPDLVKGVKESWVRAEHQGGKIKEPRGKITGTLIWRPTD